MSRGDSPVMPQHEPADAAARAASGDDAERFELVIRRLVWTVSLPIFFVEIGDTVIHILNTLFLARVGTAPLGAIALGDLIIELAIVPIVGIAEAAQIVIARRMGEHRPHEAGPAFLRMIRLALITSVALAVTLWVTAPWIASLAAGSHDVARELTRFFEVGAFAIVPLSLNLAYMSFYVGVGKPRVLVRATVILVVADTAVGAVLVFGTLGFPELGIRGAAIAFVVSETLTFAYLTRHTLFAIERSQYGLEGPITAAARDQSSVVRLGAALTADSALDNIRWVAFFIIVARAGEDVLAWSNVIYVCYAFLVIPTAAFAEGAYTVVSNVIGRGRTDRVRWLVRRVLIPAYLVTVPFVIAALVLPSQVLSLFDPGEAIAGAQTALLVVAASMLLVVPAYVWLAALFGTGDGEGALAIEVAGAVVMLVFVYLTAVVLDSPLEVIWLAVPLAALVTFAAAYVRTRRGHWESRTL